MERVVEWDHTAEPTLSNLQAMSADRAFVVYNKQGEKVGEFKSLDAFLDQGKLQKRLPAFKGEHSAR